MATGLPIIIHCRNCPPGPSGFNPQEADYPFVPVAGDGVHEIAVGPIHAGVIEPGHFRFSVVGEKVLRLEERLGYAHRGIERLFEQTPAAATDIVWQDGSPETPRSPFMGLLHGGRAGVERHGFRHARSGCVRCCSSASALPTIWVILERSATMPGSAMGSHSFPA